MKDLEYQRRLHALRQDSDPDQRFFIELLEQVWQIDPSVPAAEVCARMLAADLRWFHGYVQADAGVDFQEQALLNRILPLKDREDEGWKAQVQATAEAAKGIGPG
ncbi:MAG: hypothetical protein H6741_18835 [Alphaproteobacteria bacterium]|nr:hypothetical protein [Alphaproteobacteria bacterium]MCB9794766.1 hypothetical protein [Alphaproteobacteria bacterium]